MAWPRAPCAETSSSPRTTSSARLGRIQSPEVLEHEPPLLRREPRQLFPRRIAQPGPPARGAGLEQRGKVHTIAGGRATAAFLAFVGLAPGQGPAGVEQAAVQPLLALDRLLVETARVQLARQLSRLLRQRARRAAPTLGLQPLELLRERALARGDRAQLLEHRLSARPHHGKESARRAVQPLLVARHPRELLDRLGEPAPRPRSRDLAAAPREGERGGVERIHCLVRQRRRLGQRAVERAERLLAPRAGQRVASRPQCVGKSRQLLLRRLAGPLRSSLVTLPRRLGGALHRALRLPRGLLRRRERGLAPGRQPEVLPHLLDAVRQRVGSLLERALPRRRRAVRAPRVRVVPFGLAPLQVFRVGRERGERALRRGALEQLAAPLQLGLELLLRFGKPLQRLPRGVRVELGERLLQLAESLLELGRDRALQQLLHLAQPRLECRVVDPRGLRGPRDLLHGLGQLLHPLLQRLLLVRHRLRPFGRLERQRAGLHPRRRPPPPSRRLVTGALLRQIAGALTQVALRARDRIRGLDEAARRGPQRRPHLLEARQPQAH